MRILLHWFLGYEASSVTRCIVRGCMVSLGVAESMAACTAFDEPPLACMAALASSIAAQTAVQHLVPGLSGSGWRQESLFSV